MLIFVLSFLAGISQLLWLPFIDLNWLILPLILLSLSLFYLKTKPQTSRFSLPVLSTIILGISFGFSLALLVAANAKHHQLKNIPNNKLWVTGKITGLPIVTNMGSRGMKTRFSLMLTSSEQISIHKLIVSWYNNKETIKPGQLWRMELKLKPIHGFKNPGSFDYSKWLFRHGFDATAVVKKAELISEDSLDIMSKINRLRNNIAYLITDKFESERVQSLIMALTIGDKSKISNADSQLFQQTGTAHLIAISGLHIGLIAFVGILFGRFLFWIFANEKFNRFKYEAFFAIVFAAIYALLAGLSIPTIRAVVMVVVFTLAYAFKLNVTRWQAWSIAMLLVLVFDPFSVLGVGFWFSFGAVAILMIAFTGRKNSSNKIFDFLKAQVVILIGLLPLMVIVFQQLNLLTPLANILVLPLASIFLIPLLFAAMIMYLVSEHVADFLFVLVDKLAVLLFSILDQLQNLDFLNISIQNINTLGYILLILFAAIMLLPRLFRWRSLAFILLIPLFVEKDNYMQTNEFKVNLLDVGQGLSLVVSTKNYVLIYDTGAKYESGYSLAQSIVIPYLLSVGISKIDKIILSHADNDHAGGIIKLLDYDRSVQVYDVVGKYKPCTRALNWDWDGVKFEVLSPFVLLPYLGNNSSCVLKISSQYGSILLTGDIEEAIEYRLINHSKTSIKSDVLVIPHHGSRTSSSLDFIQQVNPKIALNSSGFANQFRHPHPLIKQLYEQRGIAFYDTQDKGMIELKFQQGAINLQQYVDENPHLWNPGF